MISQLQEESRQLQTSYEGQLAERDREVERLRQALHSRDQVRFRLVFENYTLCEHLSFLLLPFPSFPFHSLLSLPCLSPQTEPSTDSSVVQQLKFAGEGVEGEGGEVERLTRRVVELSTQAEDLQFQRTALQAELEEERGRAEKREVIRQ